MSARTRHAPAVDSAPSNYRDNLPRHLIALSRYLQSSLMQALMTERGHRDLRMHYGPVMTLVGERGARVTELAEQLAISKQAANQVVNQIEAAGYLQRQPDPLDGRAKRIVLTRRGGQLMDDGAALLDRLESEFQRALGEQGLRRLTRNLGSLYRGLALQRPSVTTRGTALGWLLPRVADQMMQRLMQLTRARGHPDLKMSFGQVLTLIGPDGGRIQAMARINGVSKQAISAVATELEGLGYLRREPDPADARQLLLKLTSAGEGLLADSMSALNALEGEYCALVGDRSYTELKRDARALYEALQVESEVFTAAESGGDTDLPALAARLRRELGLRHCRELGQLLLNTHEALS